MPLIITGSEDGTVRLWHSNTYRLENTLNYGMERVWAAAHLKGSNDVAFGYDEGIVCVKLGREEPACSMDGSGKIVWAKMGEVVQAIVKGNGRNTCYISTFGSLMTKCVFVEEVKDAEIMHLSTKDLGTCELFPQTLQHSPNGRFIVVCGDGEYIIYTALAWRNKAFGQALEFVWRDGSNECVYIPFASLYHDTDLLTLSQLRHP